MMTQKMQYPLKLNQAFFAQVRFERIPKMPEAFEVLVGVQAKIVDKRFPEVLEVHLRVETPDDQPLMMQIVVIGIFGLIKGASEPDRSIIQGFAVERAFPVLWAYMDQMITQVTSQMGMPPVRLVSPVEFSYSWPVESPSST
jgi:preprotein translocase subunit SecB